MNKRYFYKNASNSNTTMNADIACQWYKNGAIVEYWEGNDYTCQLIAWCMW